jgi:hypothetical protein
MSVIVGKADYLELIDRAAEDPAQARIGVEHGAA